MLRKNFIKKHIALLLAGILAVSSAACSNGRDIPAGETKSSAAVQEAVQEESRQETEEAAESDEKTDKTPDAAEEWESGTPDTTLSDEADIPQVPAGYTVTPENETPDIVLDVRPEVPYWFPAGILEWNPQEDEELLFHVSTVPLARRVDRKELETVNATQNRDTKLMALSIMNRNTSGNSPHGGNTAEANVFSYWQYVDTLVYWGGSSGEGLIVPPSADVTDAAHKNGVSVLGTVFMPQTAHGGKMEWLEDLLFKDGDGAYPVADKLIEAARVYGFDGWFINQETEGTTEEPLTKEHAARMLEFLSYFKEQAPELELIYYDSMTEEGQINWQNALTEKNAAFLKGEKALADGMFVNFGWKDGVNGSPELLKASAALAEELQIDPYDLYAGVDIQSDGYQTSINWSRFENPEGGTYTSLGLYCPSWAYFSAENLEDFRKKENKLWVNEAGDPSAQAEEKSVMLWRGISAYIAERTAVTSLPFVTNFCMGNGYRFFKRGFLISEADWNNRSLSDILPTYRYMIQNGEGNHLTADISMEDAWYGGSSLLLSGAMKQGTASAIRLYSAALPIAGQMICTATAKAKGGGVALDLVLTLEDHSEVVLEGDQNVGNVWTTVSYDLSGLAGETVKTISFRMTAEKDAEEAKLFLGNLTMAEAGSVSGTAVSGVQILAQGFDEDGMYAGIRLSWEADEPAAYYEIYRIHADQTRSLVGVSHTENYYMDALPRFSGETRTVLEVVPVNVLSEEGAGAQTTVEWPDNSIPKAAFTADITLAAPGEPITFQSLCSRNTEQVIWTLAGASQETARGETVSVTYSEEGVYPVSVRAENASGSSEASAEAYIVITGEASQGLSLLSGGASVRADSYVNGQEAPEFAVDGDLTRKWCATGNAPHEITLDLGESLTVSAVDLYHAGAGGESVDMNTRAYTILVSEDGESFAEVRKVTDNTQNMTHDAFAPVKARFVRLVTEIPTQGSDSAARIYEVEVYGLR